MMEEIIGMDPIRVINLGCGLSKEPKRILFLGPILLRLTYSYVLLHGKRVKQRFNTHCSCPLVFMGSSFPLAVMDIFIANLIHIHAFCLLFDSGLVYFLVLVCG